MTGYKQLLNKLKTLHEVIDSLHSDNIRKVKTRSGDTEYKVQSSIILQSDEELSVDFYRDYSTHCIVTNVAYKDICIDLSKLVDTERMLLEDRIESLFNRITDRFPKVEGISVRWN